MLDLFIQLRIFIKDAIENPATLNWATFKTAYMLYKRVINFGGSEEVWEQAGYAIRRPSTEEWFGTI